MALWPAGGGEAGSVLQDGVRGHGHPGHGRVLAGLGSALRRPGVGLGEAPIPSATGCGVLCRDHQGDAGNFKPYDGIYRIGVILMVVRALDRLSPGALDPVPAGFSPTVGGLSGEHADVRRKRSQRARGWARRFRCGLGPLGHGFSGRGGSAALERHVAVGRPGAAAEPRAFMRSIDHEQRRRIALWTRTLRNGRKAYGGS